MPFFKEELRLFLTALQFFTRVPVPAWTGWSAAQLSQSSRYFPLVGIFVGAVAGGVFEGARLLWPPTIAVLLSMVASVLLTGAFHEDGFADSCDGFGGGVERAQVLAITKDSRVGSYAVVGLVLLLAIKFQALLAFATLGTLPPGRFVLISVAAHAVSRCSVLWVMARLPYVRDDADSKSKPIAVGIGRAALVFATVVAALAAAGLGWTGMPAFLAAALVASGSVRYLRRRLGGYIGDALGATQQVAEAVFLLAVLVCVK
ncbi:MAG: adenosylcobinamide-GDP ribazoletransferase [Burkholderiales bacterium]